MPTPRHLSYPSIRLGYGPVIVVGLHSADPLLEDFVHRCGRTGRAGKSGRAVTFFTGEAHEKSLAGEFMRVLRDAGADIPKEMDRFPTTIKKKEHGWVHIRLFLRSVPGSLSSACVELVTDMLQVVWCFLQGHLGRSCRD
jgi:hypothetical protein